VAARSRRRRLEAPRAVVTEEVVPGKDVVDLKALRARVPFADIALEEPVVPDDGRPAAIAEQALRRGAATGLTGGMLIHGWLQRGRGHDAPEGRGFTNYSTRAERDPGSEARTRRYNECSWEEGLA
jgi:hypothetical protein